MTSLDHAYVDHAYVPFDGFFQVTPGRADGKCLPWDTGLAFWLSAKLLRLPVASCRRDLTAVKLLLTFQSTQSGTAHTIYRSHLASLFYLLMKVLENREFWAGRDKFMMLLKPFDLLNSFKTLTFQGFLHSSISYSCVNAILNVPFLAFFSWDFTGCFRWRKRLISGVVSTSCSFPSGCELRSCVCTSGCLVVVWKML